MKRGGGIETDREFKRGTDEIEAPRDFFKTGCSYLKAFGYQFRSIDVTNSREGENSGPSGACRRYFNIPP